MLEYFRIHDLAHEFHALVRAVLMKQELLDRLLSFSAVAPPIMRESHAMNFFSGTVPN